MRRSGSDLGVHARRPQTLLGQHRIVVAVDDVMRDARMMRLPGENWFQNLAALALVGKGFVGLRRRNRQLSA